jgi:hypothetical protein
MLTEKNLDEIGGRLEMSPEKSLRYLPKEMGKV